MKLAILPEQFVRALRTINRKRPTRTRKDTTLALTATADGVQLDTNAATAFVPAQVARGGGCEVGREAMLRILQTYPPAQPLTLEVAGAFLLIGRLRMPVKRAFLSRANRGAVR